MEPSQFSPEYWLARAEECRAIAGRMRNPLPKQAMLRLAMSYERLAQHTREQAEAIAGVRFAKEQAE